LVYRELDIEKTRSEESQKDFNSFQNRVGYLGSEGALPSLEGIVIPVGGSLYL